MRDAKNFAVLLVQYLTHLMSAVNVNSIVNFIFRFESKSSKMRWNKKELVAYEWASVYFVLLVVSSLVPLCFLHCRLIKGGPQKVSHFHESSLNRIKPFIESRFFIDIDYNVRTRIYQVCIKYSMCDLISDVITCCVWSWDTGKSKASDKIMFENQKKEKILK